MIKNNQLKELIKQSVEEAIKLHFSKKELDSSIILSREQVKEQYHLSYPTIDKYVKAGILKSYRLGRRILFKKREVDSALIKRNFNS